ncbi:MAG: tetratricopeptide repeat protein [Sphingomicrobium sp.]
MSLPTHPILRAVAWLSAAFLAAGCSSSDSRTQAALNDYQAAAATNNLFAARKALLQLVRAKDDVADYWAQLGKLQASMGSYGDAYYAFTRAYELDRSNPDLVRALTELALRSGDIGMAQAHAEELDVLAPGDPWVKLTKGWAAISESHFEEAMAVADGILVSSPFDPAVTVLKARALIGLNREDNAVDLLSKQTQEQPADTASLALLARIYERKDDWPQVAAVAKRLSELTPQDQQNMLTLIQSSLRSGNVALGRSASFRLLQPTVEPATLSAVLDLWADYGPSPQRIEDARRLAMAAGPEQRLIYAAFLSRVGSPGDAIRLVGNSATLPVNSANVEPNAVLGDALWRIGRAGEAKAHLDAVIAFDPGNATALRGRSELEMRTGQVSAAVQDAQKLVTVLPASARDRLLLARAYAAVGNRPWVERTLWTAFQDIQADQQIYNALRSTRQGNADAMNDLQTEFERQRESKLSRGLL